MNGYVIYQNYKKNILLNHFDIYYKAFSETNDQDKISSIIRCIDEKYKLVKGQEPSMFDKGYLDTLNIGNKDTSYSSYKISHYLCEKYKEYPLNHLFIITLYFRHNSICQYLNIDNTFSSRRPAWKSTRDAPIVANPLTASASIKPSTEGPSINPVTM